MSDARNNRSPRVLLNGVFFFLFRRRREDTLRDIGRFGALTDPEFEVFRTLSTGFRNVMACEELEQSGTYSWSVLSQNPVSCGHE